MAVIATIFRRFSRERDLRMLWEVQKGGLRSYLAGTAHFFPYHFRASLRRYIARVDTVLFEGPLDEGAAAQVAAAGLAGGGTPSLVRLLGADAIERIKREIGGAASRLSSHRLCRELVGLHPEGLNWQQLEGMRPWMAFFQIWSQYLRKNGWTFTMELDALRIATDLGRQAHFLETIEEQIDALDRVPLNRFVNFLEQADWRQSRQAHVQHYLTGDLEGMMARVSPYPTFCDSIIKQRDPVLSERMEQFFEKGTTMAFVGVSHCRGVREFLLDHGYRVQSPAEV